MIAPIHYRRATVRPFFTPPEVRRFREGVSVQRIFMHVVDNLDQAPHSPGPVGLILYLYSSRWITMRPVATEVPSGFREFVYSDTYGTLTLQGP
jgi:hypothetical protein